MYDSFEDYGIEFDGFQTIDSISGENDDETVLLNELSDEAFSFLQNKKWCKSIRDGYFCYGIGGIIGIFLFEIDPSDTDVDHSVWVIVGDVPPAYLSPVYCKSAKDALNGYLAEMEAWVDAIRNNAPVGELIPVNAEPNLENAGLLESRLTFLKENVLKYM